MPAVMPVSLKSKASSSRERSRSPQLVWALMKPPKRPPESASALAPPPVDPAGTRLASDTAWPLKSKLEPASPPPPLPLRSASRRALIGLARLVVRARASPFISSGATACRASRSPASVRARLKVPWPGVWPVGDCCQLLVTTSFEHDSNSTRCGAVSDSAMPPIAGHTVCVSVAAEDWTGFIPGTSVRSAWAAAIERLPTTAASNCGRRKGLGLVCFMWTLPLPPRAGRPALLTDRPQRGCAMTDPDGTFDGAPLQRALAP